MNWKILLSVMVVLGSATLRVEAQFGQFGTGDPAGESLKQAAAGGDAESQFQYGLRLLSAEGADKTAKAAGAEWVQKAAKQGLDKAMHVMGILCEEGEGVPKDLGKAAEWQGKAADAGLAEAQFRMALMHEEGKGVAKDPAAAADWAMQAATQGHAPGQALYALKLVRGEGVPKNSSKAAVWFLRAAQQGNGFSQRQLAYLYYTGNGVPVDYARCEAWYRQAASNEEDVWAMNDLAWFLATCPEDKFHKGDEAVAIAKAAIKTLPEQRHEMVDTMAAALARNGKFGEAIVWQKRCLSLLKEDKDMPADERKKLETEFSERLKLYTAGKPYSDKAVEPEKKCEPLPNDDVLNGARTRVLPGQDQRPVQPPKKKDSVI